MIIGFLLLVCLWLGYLAVTIVRYSRFTDLSGADAAVVLGAAVWDGRPSPVFEERIRHGVTLYQRGQVRALIFTGGVGAGERQAESQVARQYAVERGVRESDIHCETVSTITLENLREAKRIIDREGFARVLIVSDPLHMRRAITMATDLGIDAHPSPTPTTRYTSWRSKLTFLARETFFYALHLLVRPFY